MSEHERDQSINIDIQDEDQLENESSADQQSSTSNPPNEMDAEAPVSSGEDYYETMLRVQAEFMNYKKRNEHRMQEWRLHAAREIVAQLLPVVDDFDILFSHETDENGKVSVEGVQLIYNKLMSTLQDLGLELIDTSDRKFDPNVHEAVMVEESDEVDDGDIVKVWQKGFLYKGSLLRPAKVITAKAKSVEGGESNDE